jgi:hypothetical protein
MKKVGRDMSGPSVAGIPSREIRRLIAGPKPWHAANAYAPQAAILFDKFHIIRHLGEALEYARLAGKERRFIKGQKFSEQRDVVAFVQSLKKKVR